jgi:hypothetical protein
MVSGVHFLPLCDNEILHGNNIKIYHKVLDGAE